METKVCPACNIEKEIIKFQLNPDGSVRKHTCMACRGKKDRAKLKTDFLESFGCVCSCCGENDPRFLTLDHINDDGNKHRELLKEHQIMRQARNEGWPRDKYTCLCFNCNSGRSVNGGICPHKCLETKIEYLEKLKRLDYKFGKIHRQHNVSNLPAAREALRQKRLAMGHYGRDSATRSKEYRERHPEYKDRKRELRAEKTLASILTPEQLTLLAKLTGKSIGSELEYESGPK